jgi:hypothetical protein
MKIPKSNKTQLEKYAPKVGVSLEELESQYEEVFKKDATDYPEFTEKQRHLRTFHLIKARYTSVISRLERSNAVMYEGIVDGLGDLVDRTAIELRKIQKTYRNDPDTAHALGIVDDDGFPIDTRKELGFAKNPNYGKRLNEESPPDYVRNVYGICKRADNGVKDTFVLTAWRDVARDLSVPMYLPVKFRATQKAVGPFQLTATAVTNFEIIDNPDLDIEEEIRKFGKLRTLQTAERLKDLRGANALFRTEATITDMTLKENRMGNYTIYLSDDSLDVKEVRGFVPTHLVIDFGVFSKVLAVVQAGTIGDSTILNVMGMYPIPLFKTSVDTEKLDTADLSVGIL